MNPGGLQLTNEQNFPGDGYSHERTLTRAHLMGDNETIIECPCSDTIILTGALIREDGSSDVIECPRCHSWHSIIWRVPTNKARLTSHFTFLGSTNKPLRHDYNEEY